MLKEFHGSNWVVATIIWWDVCRMKLHESFKVKQKYSNAQGVVRHDLLALEGVR